MLLETINLTPLTATVLFVIGVMAGVRYRKVWKTEGPRWQAWLYGVVAAACLAIVALVPLAPS